MQPWSVLCAAEKPPEHILPTTCGCCYMSHVFPLRDSRFFPPCCRLFRLHSRKPACVPNRMRGRFNSLPQQAEGQEAASQRHLNSKGL